MKKTFPANIDGQVFYIDEDAYELLKNYLHQLSSTFRGEEGQEIVADIESRIRELFAERLESGTNVINLQEVQRVITTMGRPEEITEQSAEYEAFEAESESAGSPTPEGTTPPPPKPYAKWFTAGFCARHRLFRNMQDKVFGGVFGGLALYLGWNSNIMRVLYVALTVCTYFWPLTIIYLIAWMIIPPAVTPRQVLEMKGVPVNVDSIGQTLVAPPVYKEDAGQIITNALKVAGKVVMSFVGFFSGIGLFASTMAFICLAAGMAAYGLFDSLTILRGLDLVNSGFDIAAVWLSLWGLLVVFLIGIIVSGSLLWTSCCVVFKTRSASRSTIITTLVVLAVLIALAICLFGAYNGLR